MEWSERMPRPRIEGAKVLSTFVPNRRRKPSQWLPKYTKRFWYLWGDTYIRFRFQPVRGLYPEGMFRRVSGAMEPITLFPDLWSKSMKKFSMGIDKSAPLPALSSESAILKKFPHLRNFFVTTAYDDGSARAPGRVWLENDGIAFVVTLMEPSAFARVRLRAATLDDMFMVAELHLGTENAPWELDQWQLKRHQEMNEKKTLARRKKSE